MFRTFDKEKNKKVWRTPIILISELLGTFLMVLWIIVPSAWNLVDNTTWYADYFSTFIMKAFWVAGFILILIVLLRWISVNLNPAVTLGEVAVGNTSWRQAYWMIGTQFLGAFLAAYFAFYVADHVIVTGAGTEAITWAWDATGGAADSIWAANSNHTLDAVYPLLQTSGNEQEWFGLTTANGTYVNALENIFTLWDAEWATNSSALAFMLVPAAIEFLFTLMLISSVVYTSDNKHVKAILIFLTLMFVVTLGIHTNNIALNPARLLAPAIVSASLEGGNIALPAYALVFLAGEMLAVLFVFRKENRKAIKQGTTMASVRREVTEIMDDVAILRGKYKWVVEGNKAFDSMTEAELEKAIAAHGAEEHVIKKGTQKQRTNSFVKFLVFGPEKTAPKKISKKQKAKADKIAEKKGVTQVEAKEETSSKKAKKK